MVLERLLMIILVFYRSTVTTTVTTTSTVSTALTISAPATFTPIQTSLPGTTYGGSGGADPVEKRDIYKNIPVKRASSNKPGLVAHAGHPKYPQEVFCYRWTHHRCATEVVTSTKTVIQTTSTRLATVCKTLAVLSRVSTSLRLHF